MSRPNPEIQRRVAGPQFGGRFPDDLPQTHQGMAKAEGCGDVLSLKLACDETGAHILAARHLTYGCPAAIAAGEWVCEFLQGRPRRLAEQLRLEDVLAGLKAGPELVHVGLLVTDALADALN